MHRRLSLFLISLTISAIILLSSCMAEPGTDADGRKLIVVTYPILGSLVKELAGDNANVTVLMPNGSDPHSWEPSAKDIEAVNKADLVVQNGLALESGIQKTIYAASLRGVKTFSASDYIDIRHAGENESSLPESYHNDNTEEEAHGAEHEHNHLHDEGAGDPHLWTDPVSMKNVAIALADTFKKDLGINTDSRCSDLQERLDTLNDEITSMVSAIPAGDRKLVTGHESMGYFARRYGFQIIGAIIPGVTSQAAVSAYDLAALKKLIQENKIKAIFTEVGTSPAVASAISNETGIRVVEINTHLLPEDGSYFTFIRNLAKAITEGLK